MLHRFRVHLRLAVLVGLAACSDIETPLAPADVQAPVARNAVVTSDAAVRLNEIHYDNAGADEGEAVELITLPGLDLTGWAVVFYNGTASQRSPYATVTLSGVADIRTCTNGEVGLLRVDQAGIQNGSPDGLAIVDPAGTVVEFLSYEGTFEAASGPAAGLTSVEIGSESSSTPVGNSIALVGDQWVEGPNSFGECNGAPPPPTAEINEIHYDNAGTDEGEAIEVLTDEGANLAGFQLVLYNGSNGTVYSTTDLGTATVTNVDGAGYAVVTYPSNGIQNGSPDGVALVDPDGVVLEFLSYEGTLQAVDGPAAGLTSTDIGEEPSDTPVDESLSRQEDGSWAVQAATFGGPNDVPTPEPTAPVFISELHYDNAGADVDEAVEISGPAGTSLDGWRVFLYNGSNGTTYGSITLDGTLPSCQPGGGLVFPRSGIQNGSPDGLALVDPAGTVVEFLSYEGTLTAADGPAAGLTSMDIGVAEASSTEIGQSLQRVGGVWAGPAVNTFGCQPPAQVFLSEVRLDQPGADNDEYLEIGGPAEASLDGVTFVVLGDDSSGNGVIEEIVSLAGQSLDAAGAFVVGDSNYSLSTPDLTEALNFENGDNPTLLLVRGFSGSNGQDLDLDNDGTLDTTPWTEVVDCLSLVEFLGLGPIYCDQRIGADVSFTPGHAKRNGDGWFSANFTPGPGDTPGVIEFDTSNAAPGVIAPWGVNAPGVPTNISVSASFVELPVGFNRALFLNVFDDFRNPVEGLDITNTSSDPGVVTADRFGNLTATGTGTATLTFSAGSLASTDVTVEVVPDVPSGVTFQNNVEFGVPTDGNAADDVIVVRDEYTASYNPVRNAANWVSWNLDPEHFGEVDRCDCYTFDPQLAAQGLTPVVNFDYTGSGYSRGHMAMSVNRTATLPDNAATYFLTNILPQSSANNGGPWLDFEIFTNDRVRENGREAYVVAGGVYSANPGTLKDEGKVQIPEYTFKVAVFVGRDETLADVETVDDLEVIAILTPNTLELDSEIASRGNEWEAYEVDVAEIEALTGYDVLSALPDRIEAALETGFDDLEQAFAGATASGALTLQAAKLYATKLRVIGLQLSLGNDRAAVALLQGLSKNLGRAVRRNQLDAATAASLQLAVDRVVENLQR